MLSTYLKYNAKITSKLIMVLASLLFSSSASALPDGLDIRYIICDDFSTWEEKANCYKSLAPGTVASHGFPSENVAYVFRTLGSYQAAAGKRNEAIASYKFAIDNIESLKQRDNNNYFTVVMEYAEIAEVYKKEELFLKSIRIALDTKYKHYSIGRALMALSIYYYYSEGSLRASLEIGDKSSDYLQKHLEILNLKRSAGFISLFTTHLVQHAERHRDSGHLSKALGISEKAWSLMSKYGERDARYWFINLKHGQNLASAGRYEAALERFKSQEKETGGYKYLYEQMAIAYCFSGNFKKYDEYISKLSNKTKTKYPGAISSENFITAYCEHKRGNNQQALKYIRDSISNFKYSTDTGIWWKLAKPMHYIGVDLDISDLYLLILRANKKFYQGEESFVASQYTNNARVSRYIDQAALRHTFVSQEHKKVLRNRQSRIARVDQYRREILAGLLAETIEQNIDEIVIKQHQKASLEKKIESVNNYFKNINKSAYTVRDIVNSSDISKLLSRKQVFIKIREIGRDIGIWVQRHNEPLTIRLIEDLAGPLRSDIELVRKSLNCNINADATSCFEQFAFPASCRIHEVLFRSLNIAGQASLVIVAEGALSEIPWNALISADRCDEVPKIQIQQLKQVNWFGKLHPFSILPSISAFKALSQQSNDNGERLEYLGIGDPLIGQNGLVKAINDFYDYIRHLGREQTKDAKQIDVAKLPRLIFSREEIRAVAKQLKISDQHIFLQEKATKGNIFELNRRGQLENYRILHFSTHGLMRSDIPNLLEPALVLTPSESSAAVDLGSGVLKASEIVKLSINADLVVLSACNTAASLDKGEKPLSGLAASFFLAGARSVLVSDWPVSATAAAQLVGSMVVTSRNEDLTFAEALNQTISKTIRESYSLNQLHPLYWGGFYLVGFNGKATR